MELTSLEKHPEFRQQTIQLIEKAFNYTTPYQFAIDFYPLMAPDNAANNHIVIKDKRVIAHLGVQLRKFNGDHQVALLGGIAVDENYRGQGVFTKLMNKIIDQYTDHVAMFLLWSDKTSLYERFEFHLAIGQLAPIKKELLPDQLKGFIKKPLNQLSSVEQQDIQELYQAMAIHYTCLERDPMHWNNIFNIASTDAYLYYDEDQILQYYFFANKGFDLQNIIHEVGFELSQKENLFRKISAYNLWLPESEISYFPEGPITYMASIKIGNSQHFKNFISDWSSQKIKLKKIDNEVIFIFEDKEFVTSLNDFLQYIWGPYPFDQFADIGLPIYIPGVDSI